MKGIRLKNKVSGIIQKVYGNKYRLNGNQTNSTKTRTPYPRAYYPDDDANPFVDLMKENRIRLIMLVSVLSLALMSVYYYNVLVDSEQNMLAAIANVDAQLQRRVDCAQNLAKAVAEYSKHEQQVFSSVVSLRSFMSAGDIKQDEQLQKLAELVDKGKQAGAETLTLHPAGAEPTAGAQDLLSSLSSLVAIAEQYPDLKLSTNIGSQMASLVEVEKDLATERIKLNDVVNIYTTNVARFPCNVFAKIFGFRSKPYFEGTSDARTFRLFN